jgi:uncharacterized alkaline shock family protein YloU
MDGNDRQERPGHGAATEVTLGGTAGEGGEFRGTVRVAPAVLIELIDLTMQGISGFAGLRNHGAGPEPDGGTARRFSNGKIAVTVDGDRIAVAVGCAIVRGTNVAEFTSAVQRAIGFAAGNMLNMTVQTVDLMIQEVTAASSAT